jgi:hypothetical protein
MDFLSSFKEYDIYVIIDDNEQKYENYTNIKCIQIDNTECRNSGYVNVNFFIGKEISGWDKALYYFSKVNTSYENVWFMEDDVFIYNESTLLNIDTHHIYQDLLCPSFMGDHTSPWPHWPMIRIEIPPPYVFGMVCACRISNKLLKSINEYATKYNTLFFLEALFPTLAKQHTMQIAHPKEMETIVYRRDCSIQDINKQNVYHPVKDIRLHVQFRSI